MGTTLYDLLGVKRKATLSEIEEGYHRRMAACRAGSRSDEDWQQLQAIAGAYRVLSSTNRRQIYDRKLDAQRRLQIIRIMPLAGAALLAAATVVTVGNFLLPEEKAFLSGLKPSTVVSALSAGKLENFGASYTERRKPGINH